MEEIVKRTLDEIPEWKSFARMMHFVTLYEGYNYGAL
jgi:hypothetical protein